MVGAQGAGGGGHGAGQRTHNLLHGRPVMHGRQHAETHLLY